MEHMKSHFLGKMNPIALEVYMKCITCIGEHEIPKACVGLLANYLLYQYSPMNSLEPEMKPKIDQLSEQATNIIISECSEITIQVTREDLSAISCALHVMSNLFKNSF